MTSGDVISWLAQAALAAGTAVGAFLLALPTKLGDRLLNFHLDRKLAEFKERQEQQIERLKDRLRHFEDRGKRSNEKEYEALSEIWAQFVDVLQATERAVIQFTEHPDLDRMNGDDLAQFLDSTELSQEQKKNVSSSSDRNRAYSQSLRWLMLAAAHNRIFELRAALKKRSIFIPENLVRAYDEAIELCSKAEVAEFVRFRHPDSNVGHDDTLAFFKSKAATFDSLRDATRVRLLRDLGE